MPTTWTTTLFDGLHPRIIALRWSAIAAFIAGALNCSSNPAPADPTPPDATPTDGTLHCEGPSPSYPLSCPGDENCELTTARTAAIAACGGFEVYHSLEAQCPDGTIDLTLEEGNSTRHLYFRNAELVADVGVYGLGTPDRCSFGPNTFKRPEGCLVTRNFCAKAEDGGAGADSAD